jgi:hypothetical protein
VCVRACVVVCMSECLWVSVSINKSLSC